MKTGLALVASCSVALMVGGTALAQDQPWWDGAPAGTPSPATQPGPAQPPPGPVQAAQVQAVPEAQPAATGEWVYTAQYGWIWVPYGSTTTVVGAEPYVYLYAPAVGWTWFVSPWGPGPFRYGSWGWGPRWGSRYAPQGWVGAHHHGGWESRGVVRYAPRPFHAVPAERWGGAHFGGARGFGGGHAGGGHHR